MTLADTLAPKAPPLRECEGGIIKLAGSRVTLDTIVAAYWAGMTAEQIATAYESLSVADIHAVLSYYLQNRTRVDEYIAAGERQSDELHRQLDLTSPWAEMRQRLLARQAKHTADK